MYIYQDQVMESLPERIRLDNGMTRSSLNELSIEQLETLGIIQYQDVTLPGWETYIWSGGYTQDINSEPVQILIPTNQWSGEYIIDYDLKTCIKVIIDIPSDSIKTQLLEQLSINQKAVQDAGMVCSNNIKLQVDETSLIRWTQLMIGLSAFQPPTVSIRDYDNVVHEVSLSVASQVLAEVFVWGQMFIADTWAKKDAINAG